MAKISRRAFSKMALSLALSGCGAATRENGSGTGIPLILDSDIGDDIDDTWALLMLLRSPELDLKLVVSDYGNATYRCRLFAKLLELTGRTDIPIAMGLGHDDEPGRQSAWIGDYQLGDYPGRIHEDGVQTLIDTIKGSRQPVTLMCIGPVPNIAEALRRDPSIAENARFIGMHGSVRVGYGGAPEPSAEWNVKVDAQSLQQVFAAPWDCTITPLDTCGMVRLKDEKYRKIARSDDPWLRALLENYRVFLPLAPFIEPGTHPDKNSTTLFDTVAIYLAYDEDFVEMEDLPLRVTDDGYTVIDSEAGRNVHCAMGWKDLAAFEDALVDRLLGAG